MAKAGVRVILVCSVAPESERRWTMSDVPVWLHLMAKPMVTVSDSLRAGMV